MKIMNPREEERNKRGATRREGRGSSQDVVCVLVMAAGGEEMKWEVCQVKSTNRLCWEHNNVGAVGFEFGEEFYLLMSHDSKIRSGSKWSPE